MQQSITLPTPKIFDMSEKEARLSGVQTAGPSQETNLKPENAENNDVPVLDIPYSIFTKSQKLGIVLLVALASVYSPLSSFIYYPALTAVAGDLHTTISKVNLTITSYMVVSGVGPMILGSIADQLGRRPVYLFMFLMYVIANVGLALQTSYPALLLLRMLQSAGGSATIGLGYGVVGDITESSERGAYMGIFGCGPNVAPSLGPILGGVLAQKAGWRWIFGFLAISGALSLVLIAVILPETARNVVGNGSRSSPGWNKSILKLWEEKSILSSGQQTGVSEDMPRITKLRIPNPIRSVSILLYKDTAPVVFVNAVFYTAYCCLQASLSSLFITIYGYKELEAGLVYMPFGVGCFIASLLSCKLRHSHAVLHNWVQIITNAVRYQAKILTNDYRCIANRQGLPTSSNNSSQSQTLAFPIFRARLRSMVYLLPLSTLCLLAYGWVLEYHLHPSISLLLQFFIGGSITIIFNACGTLLVDLHPSCPSTAQASLNIVRCTFAAAGLAALQPLINAVGTGWCFTMIALVSGGMGTACVVLEGIWGESWRRQRQSSRSGEESRSVGEQ